MDDLLKFKPVESSDMERIVPYFKYESGRSCDVSYGGILMWSPLFGYEFAEYNDTLFIRGRTPNGKWAYYPPLGKLSVNESLEILKTQNGEEVILYPVPEYSLEKFQMIPGAEVEECPTLADYIYDIETLSSLRGKKMSKKRNHVNQFENNNPDWSYEPLTDVNKNEILQALASMEKDAQQTEGARLERKLTAGYVSLFSESNPGVHGGVLRVGGKPVALSVGDVRGDTLFVQIEKAPRDINGAHEMINRLFAADMLERYPDLKYVNREEDAGDPGLRYAKESYHPVFLLRKYKVTLPT